MDVALASVIALLTSPLMLLTALAIKLDSRGPVFYLQERVGLNNTTFRIIKFRSMRVDAEANGPVWAHEGDSRVTRVGRWIRKRRIDELPQLFNIIRGEMSLIGPRPERPVFIKQLEQRIPYYSERHLVKPGLTGWAQVRYPYGASFEDARENISTTSTTSKINRRCSTLSSCSKQRALCSSGVSRAEARSCSEEL